MDVSSAAGGDTDRAHHSPIATVRIIKINVFPSIRDVALKTLASFFTNRTIGTLEENSRDT